MHGPASRCFLSTYGAGSGGASGAKAGIKTRIGCHSFRATGITNYLEHRSTQRKAQQMAAYASPRTTKLYDRTNDQVTLDEMEKITL